MGMSLVFYYKVFVKTVQGSPKNFRNCLHFKLSFKSCLPYYLTWTKRVMMCLAWKIRRRKRNDKKELDQNCRADGGTTVIITV